MNFFEAQARVKKRSSRLFVLFGLAVLGTILAGYIAAVLIFRQLSPRAEQFQQGFRDYQRSGIWSDEVAGTHWWDPRLFAAVSVGTLAVVGLASLYKWNQFNVGGSAVAESVGGRRVEPNTTDLNERRLLNVVEEMAIASGTPVPTVYLLPDEAGINAFAAGLTTSDAIVAVTRGTLEKLNRDELQGVIAHEFSHILNGDMRMNLRIAAVVFGILVLGLAGRGILWSMRGARTSRGKGSGGMMAAIMLAGMALLIVGYIGYFFGRMIQAAVSRQREFLADASAVQFTRNPSGIMGALKKIGGYALGSRMTSNKSTALGHFFFAQGFRSGLTGLWSTHPPLETRLRAIDPNFQGEMFSPPELVDVARESFVGAGLVESRIPPVLPKIAGLRPAAALPDLHAATLHAVEQIGTLTDAHLQNAELLLNSTPPRLRAAAQAPASACVLLYGLLLDADPAVRQRQRSLVASGAGAAAARALDELEVDLVQLAAVHKLPLLQLSAPALRNLPPAELDRVFDTLDELVHADARVSTFEFTLQKLIVHTLSLGRAPATAGAQLHSFRAVADEISVVLSALACAATSDLAFAPKAFARGAQAVKLIEEQLRFHENPRHDFAALDAALDRLAYASLPIKQRVLQAAVLVVSADGRVLVSEIELLRAIAASLDCPMPPLASPS